MRRLAVQLILLLAAVPAAAQNIDTVYTHADTLRGSNGPGRDWWDASFYDLHVRVNPADSSIRGWNGITYRVLKPAGTMQIDLQMPLEIDSIVQDRRKLTWRRDGNAFFVALRTAQRAGDTRALRVYYHGQPGHDRPRPAGFLWAHDSLGGWWLATTDEGIGASVWWPVKDYPADEPDSQRIAITVPDPLIDVSNGRLRGTTHNADGTTTFEWFVADPINLYDVAVNAGRYTHYSDTLAGESGPLSLDFWPLEYHADTARGQWKQATPMLKCFEHWYGPYPWYRDGYKLIEQSYLGMEHQSGIAYGNRFLKGYLGRDLSGTGLGLSWDYIVIHESAHEWFGNAVSAADVSDMWIHEGWATYLECLYVEYTFGHDDYVKYTNGYKSHVQNREPIITFPGLHREPPQDMYFKGALMLHTLRSVIDDDAKWTALLHDLYQEFKYKNIGTTDVVGFVNRRLGMNLTPFFDEYLRHATLPQLDLAFDQAAGTVSYRWSADEMAFAMPIRVGQHDHWQVIRPTTAWQTMKTSLSKSDFEVATDLYFVNVSKFDKT